MTEKVKKKQKRKKKVSDYVWVVRGSQKRKIIKSLNKAKMPSQIRKDTKLGLNNVSDVLREFRKRKLVELENPDDKTGRFYKLTPRGFRVREKVEEYGEKEED